jgi:MFS family permease
MSTTTVSTVEQAPKAARSRRLSRPVTFAALAAIFMTFMAASAAPSPLYVVYQHAWGFSASVLTVIFAVYVAGMVASLLVLGALSDHVGRRPVLAAAVALEAVALVLFLSAGDVTVLLVARLVQGVATGAALTTLGAALVDLNPPHAPGRAGLINGLVPPAGLAVGALGAGALVQFAPAPTHLVWAVLLLAMALAALVVAVMPETSQLRPGGVRSLIPRLGVPARLRSDVLALVPIIVASWAIGGLYLSLGPSVAAGLLGLSNHLIGGLVVMSLFGPGAITAFVLRTTPTARTLAIAGTLLTLGPIISIVGVQLSDVPVALAGTVISGIGFGGAALAQMATLARLAAPQERAELLTVALVIAYVAFSVPAVIAGFASGPAGLHRTTLVYAAVVAALGATAVVAQKVRAISSDR